MARFFSNPDRSGLTAMMKFLTKIFWNRKKRHKELVLRPYLRISFDTDFEALSNGVFFFVYLLCEMETKCTKSEF